MYLCGTICQKKPRISQIIVVVCCVVQPWMLTKKGTQQCLLLLIQSSWQECFLSLCYFLHQRYSPWDNEANHPAKCVQGNRISRKVNVPSLWCVDSLPRLWCVDTSRCVHGWYKIKSNRSICEHPFWAQQWRYRLCIFLCAFCRAAQNIQSGHSYRLVPWRAIRPRGDS